MQPSPAPVDLRARLMAVARGTDGRWAATAYAAEARRVLTRRDPKMFAAIYMSRHLRGPETGDRVSFSQFHLDLAVSARQWTRTDLGPREVREAWVAPRGSGKSTWLFGILPIWAMAHGHRKFIAAFADSGTQAQQHLMSIKRELDTNELLRHDYPLLCTPARRPGGVTVSDSQTLMLTESGAAIMARGIDSSTLGAKLGSHRPDLLLFDDIEPSASNYSAYQKEKRQDTIVNAVFPMSLNAVVVFAGTTTMAGSVMHDIARQATEPGDAPQWVLDERIVTKYYPAILTLDDGSEASLWPERWSLEYLQSIRHTRSYQMNYANDPMGADGDYWAPEDIRYGLPTSPLTHELLSIDPAVTTKGSSDYTGLAVVGFCKPQRVCVVRWARAVKVAPGAPLRDLVLRTLEAFPAVRGVVVEQNQGGDVWRGVLHGLPVPVTTVHQSEPKDVRAARFLSHYQQGRVLHEQRLPALEQQLVAYPKAPNDDLVDAAGTGVTAFLGKKPAVGVTSASYV